MELLSKTKWRIIEGLSKGDKSPVELARAMKMSVPTIYLQLVELERMGLISKSDLKNGKTRPFQQYSIGEGFLFFIKAMPNETLNKLIKIDENIKLHFRVWSIPQQEFHQPVEEFYWRLKPKLRKIDTIAVFGSVARGDANEESDIDILLLCDNEFKISPEMVDGKVFTPQVFLTEDFKRSLKEGSKFANEIIKDMIIIYDKKGVLQDAKRGAI